MGALAVLRGLTRSSFCLPMGGRGFILARALSRFAFFGFCGEGLLGGFLFMGLGGCGRGSLVTSLLLIILFITSLLSKMVVTQSPTSTTKLLAYRNRLHKNAPI